MKCKMVLAYDLYTEILQNQKEKEDEIQIMKQQISVLMQSQKEIIECLKYPHILTKINSSET